jgi:hypothetical protein
MPEELTEQDLIRLLSVNLILQDDLDWVIGEIERLSLEGVILE